MATADDVLQQSDSRRSFNRQDARLFAWRLGGFAIWRLKTQSMSSLISSMGMGCRSLQLFTQLKTFSLG